VWITAEDFEPEKADRFSVALWKVKKYDSLCFDCYKSECCKKEVKK
jgi:hypothetical protein